MKVRPAWLEVADVSPIDIQATSLLNLDLGEREAIALATRIGAGQIVMDETLGKAAAAKLGLQVIGTLGVLREAAQRGLIDLPETIRRLQETRFRIAKHILEEVLRTAPERRPGQSL